MGIIAWIIFGLIAGAIAKFLMPGKDPGGFIVTHRYSGRGGWRLDWYGAGLWQC